MGRLFAFGFFVRSLFRGLLVLNRAVVLLSLCLLNKVKVPFFFLFQSQWKGDLLHLANGSQFRVRGGGAAQIPQPRVGQPCLELPGNQTRL